MWPASILHSQSQQVTGKGFKEIFLGQARCEITHSRPRRPQLPRKIRRDYYSEQRILLIVGNLTSIQPGTVFIFELKSQTTKLRSTMSFGKVHHPFVPSTSVRPIRANMPTEI